ncbi:MAG: hypothetical protein FWC09_02680 [Lachnospiraceae bacterium]|nr:hypothetical protein [Lachnospiraceae bacterium]
MTEATAIIIASIIAGIFGFLSIIFKRKLNKTEDKKQILEAEINNLKEIYSSKMEPEIITIKEAGEVLIRLLKEPVSSVDIIGSRVSFCRELIRMLAQNGKINKNTEIHILFRMGYDMNRYDDLKESGEAWADLSKSYDLDIKFHFNTDYEHGFQGLVFDENIGIIGYFHMRGKQFVAAKEYMLLFKGSPHIIHNYMIKKFVDCFELKKPPYNYNCYKSISEAIDAFKEKIKT